MTYAPAKFEVALTSALGVMQLQEIFDLTLTQSQSQGHNKALPSTPCDLCTCKL